MPSTTDISPLSITDGKISNEARIAHAKLAKAVEGQVLVAQANGKFAAKSLAGDVTLDSSGNTTSNVAVSADGTTVVTGATGAAGVKGDTGNQGAAGPTGPAGAAGSDANVTAENVDGALGFTGSTAGLVKRTADNTFALDSATYSTSGHDHDHDALTNFVAAEHVDWAASSAGTIHATNYTHTHPLSAITDSGTAAPLNVPASGDAASGEVVKGSDTRLTDARTPTTHSHAYSSLTSIPSTFAAIINDLGTGATDVWSASKIVSVSLAQIASYAPVKHFTVQIDWATDQTAEGVTYPEGSSPIYGSIVEIAHNLATNFVVCSVTDVDGVEKDANTQFDMNFEDEVLVKIVSNNKIRLTFNPLFEFGIDDGFYVTIMGAV